jgi:hypothetical protein
MLKNLCLKPNCLNKAIVNKKYCKKHQAELELKSELYFKEMKDEHSINR